MFADAPALRWTYLAVGAVGVGFYVYRELFARYVLSHHDYEVEEVRVVDDGVVEISLRPLGTGVDFVPGQFAMIFIEAKDGWHRHPFTLSSAPSEGRVRITVKALGDYTSQLEEIVQVGMPAVIGPPHGHFDRHRGTARQVWIAGGSVSRHSSVGCVPWTGTSTRRWTCSTALTTRRPSGTKSSRSPMPTRCCASTWSTRVSRAS